MIARSILISAGLGYLLGSIPFGYVLVRAFHGSDIRESGSGNIGATNVARTSPILGIATLFLDAAKGLGAVLLVLNLFPDERALAFVAAFGSICGHIFPVWLGFRGGKGVATALGAFFLLTPKAILLIIGIFLLVAVIFRMIALASVFAAASFPVAIWLTGEIHGSDLLSGRGLLVLILPPVSILASSALVIARHHTNIRRILADTEPKFELRRK